MALLLKRTSPYTYPGSAPGVNPSHPASVRLLFSAVAFGSAVADLTVPQLPSVVGAAPSPNIIDAYLGPAMASLLSQRYSFARHPATLSQVGTVAGIVNFNGVTADSAFIDSANDNGWKLGVNPSSLLTITAGGQLAIPSTLSLTANVPYFVASSVSADLGIANFIATRLDTGRITVSKSSFGSFGAAAPNGTFEVGMHLFGGGSGGYNGIAAVMSAATLLSPVQLLAWARDPWLFWYPRTLDLSMMIGATLPPAVMRMGQAWM